MNDTLEGQLAESEATVVQLQQELKVARDRIAELEPKPVELTLDQAKARIEVLERQLRRTQDENLRIRGLARSVITLAQSLDLISPS